VQKNLERSLSAILGDEGGFALRASEPGGSVNKGISMLVFEEWRLKQKLPPPSIDELRKLTTAEASAIYTERYWKPLHGDELPSGVDYALLNTAVMEGVVGSVTLLQHALGTGITGHYNDGTWAALMRTEPHLLIAQLIVQHLNKKLHSLYAGRFGIGWSDRIIRVFNRASEMA
jgi:lysozyme family protein